VLWTIRGVITCGLQRRPGSQVRDDRLWPPYLTMRAIEEGLPHKRWPVDRFGLCGQ
jgi:hypothetical protein